MEEHTIIKPLHDDRVYKYIKLANGLDVALVHDSATQQAALTMDVGVGSLGEPLEGLAHLCEHMLFVSTEKFPEEGSWSNFVSSKNGLYNAYTSGERTQYFIELPVAYLLEALERFSSFFICPTFDPNGTSKELAAVDSEHTKNKISDAWRFQQLRRSLTRAGHPINEFATGSFRTLRDELGAEVNLVESLKEFHRQHYCSERMKLVLVSSLPMEQMQELVTQHFTPIKSNPQSVALVVPNEPLADPNTGKLYRIEPVEDSHHIQIYWSLPEGWKDYKTSTVALLTHYCGHEASGSIISTLRVRQLATDLSAGFMGGTSSFTFFGFDVTLTEAGVAQWESVGALCHQYVQLLRETDMARHRAFYDEAAKVGSNSFVFQEKHRASECAETLATAMSMGYAPEHWLCGASLMEALDESVLGSFLARLTPDSAITWLVSPGALLGVEEQLIRTDVNYGTRYCEAQMAPQSVSSVDAALRLPKENPFVSAEFPLCEESAVVPRLLQNDEYGELWWQIQPSFNSPKGIVFIELGSAFAYTHPRAAVLSALYSKLLADHLLEEVSYYAQVAGMVADIRNTNSGLLLTFKGFNDKLPVLVEHVLQLFSEDAPELRWSQFEIVKEALVRKYNNFHVLNPPYQQAMYYESVVCELPRWSMPEYAAQVASVTPEELRAHIAHFFTAAHFKALVSNTPKSVACCIGELVQKRLFSAPRNCPAHLRLGARFLQVPPGHTVYSREAGHPEQDSAAVLVAFSAGADSVQSAVSAELFNQLVAGPLVETLRLQEQFGYVVLAMPRVSVNAVRWQVLIQTEKTVERVDEAVERFIGDKVPGILEAAEATLEAAVHSLLVHKEEPVKNISELATDAWAEIDRRNYQFERKKQEAEYLKSGDVTLEGIKQFYASNIAKSAATRRKLTVRVLAGGYKPGATSVTDETLRDWQDKCAINAKL